MEAFDADQEFPALPSTPSKLRLSWYHGQTVRAGERWQLRLRLKPPHGFMNPAGFDYEAWLYQQGIHATGYVRNSSDNQRLAVDAFSLDALRQTISEHISAALAANDQVGLINALAVGERSQIGQQQWQQLDPGLDQ